MSSLHQPLQPNSPGPSSEESESDIELDINELDPQANTDRQELYGSHQWRQPLTDRRIPLRNLRVGRAAQRRPKEFDVENGDDEAAHGLLDEDSRPRDSTEASQDYNPVSSRDKRRGRNDSSRDVPTRLSSQLASSGPLNDPSKTNQETSANAQDAISDASSRNISIGQYPPPRFPLNAISNAKYTAWSFLPRTLYNEFSFFFNMYFLLVALSQLIPPLRIGYVSTYVVPLVFVLAVTLGKEAVDDLARRRRDAEANREEYTVLRLQVPGTTSSRKRKAKRKANEYLAGEGATTRYSGPSHLEAIEEEEANLEANITGSPNNFIRVDALSIRSRDLKVGDVVKLCKDQRVPADVVILKSYSMESEAGEAGSKAQGGLSTTTDDEVEFTRESLAASPGSPKQEMEAPKQLGRDMFIGDSNTVGETFIRTDQLDGETDWKLRLASPLTQPLDPRQFAQLKIVAGKPSKRINEFIGTIEYTPRQPEQSQPQDSNKGEISKPDQHTLSAPLNIDNTAWANTVLASNAAVLAVVVYTGAQTRQAMSTSNPRSKNGLLDSEINNLTKILCALTLTLSIVLVALEGFENQESMKCLRVNLDMGKSVYAWFIERDRGIPDTIVRTSTIPEELGRIEYLLSDKTGTLTQNEMQLKKIHVGTVSYANEAMDEVASYIRQGFITRAPNNAIRSSSLVTPSSSYHTIASGASTTRTRREIGSRVCDLVLALALCHNVTPTSEEEDGRTVTTYQASSPDEIAIVKWTESVGLQLVHRDRQSISLRCLESSQIIVCVRILDVFPFTSETKRMGIILRFSQDDESETSPVQDGDEIWFFQKGADTVMTSIVAANDWLDEETVNMAREGFRTLVIGRRKLSFQQYQEFREQYNEASLALRGRDTRMARVVRDHLESNLELLGVTGVEDKLQTDVKPSLELLRNAGIKIWMLTGDKVETARCVAVSAKLVSRTQYIHTITQLSPDVPASTALDTLSILRSKPDSTALLIDGDSLSYFLSHHRWEFISVAVLLPAVIACRCSPTQKADIAYLIRQFTKKRVACIGDGGNDVSMIQAADVGVGIVGKEGRQASLAADFSITSFHHLTKLLVWHGRNSYKRSAKLAQFIIHRGLIISVCQTIYSIAAHYEPNALYRDWLLVGYATVYTMAPVFSLVLDKDVDEGLANLYPELYKELTNGHTLSYRTFFVWVAVSIYQGSIIQGLSQILVGSVDSPQMVSVSFTVLVINELIMVACEIVTWHLIMVISLLGTMAIYIGSVPFLGGYFDLGYVWSWGFAWRVAAISAISLIPPYSVKILRRTLKPPSYRKVQGI
ncbi:MAG: hypothetical protein Q9167_006973 [Letrouitia subvulpina]